MPIPRPFTRLRLRVGPGSLVAAAAACVGFVMALALWSPVRGAEPNAAESPAQVRAAAPAAAEDDAHAKPTNKHKGKPHEAGPDTPGPDAQPLGSAFCGAPACHGSLVKDSLKVRHSHWTSNPKYKEAAGCEVCHGPASDHIGDPDKRKIYRFTVQSPENSRRINETCLKCHQDTVRKQHFTGGTHARAGVSCATCHEVHYNLGTPYMLRLAGAGGPAGRPTRERDARKPVPAAEPAAVTAPADPNAPEPPPHEPRLAAAAKTRAPMPELRTSFQREPGAATEEQAVNELCASCHRRQVSEARQFSHHPLLEGRMKCTSCHDAHAVDQDRAHADGAVSEKCLQCHEQLRGPFRFEHDPVKAGGLGDGCLECHRPHGSPNRALTTLFSRGLCVQCHTDIQRDPPHRARTGDCWRSGCHTAMHGSNHSRFFFRE